MEDYPDTIDKVILSVNEGTETPFNVGSLWVAQSTSEEDVNLSFHVDVEDSDNDVTSATIGVEFDGDKVMTGAYGNEVFVGGPEAETIYADDGDGLDTIFYDDSMDTLVADPDDDVNATSTILPEVT